MVRWRASSCCFVFGHKAQNGHKVRGFFGRSLHEPSKLNWREKNIVESNGCCAGVQRIKTGGEKRRIVVLQLQYDGWLITFGCSEMDCRATQTKRHGG